MLATARLPPRRRRSRSRVTVAIFLLLGLAALAAWLGYGMVRYRDFEHRAIAITGGDPGQGREALRRYGCIGCHTIPGVRGAHGLVGPPLAGIARRMYVGGVLPNTPEDMMRWIRDPRGVDPLTAMPNTGVTEAAARDITAFLYTLR